MIKLKIANGGNEHSRAVKNVEITWDKLLERISKPKIQPESRSYIVAGHCLGGVRNADNVKYTSVGLIDIDDKAGAGGITFNEIAGYLDFNFPYRWAAYTTRSYNGENSCFRIVVPFNEQLNALKHRSAIEYLVAMLPETWQQRIDGASFTASQPMFLSCVKEAGAPFESDDGGEVLFNPTGLDLAADYESDAFDDIELELLSQPLDMTDDEVNAYLDAIDPNTLTYGMDDGTFGWNNVIAAIAHQYKGSAAGLDLAIAWSQRNPEKFDDKETRYKYSKFKQVARGGRKPTTMASVIKYVKDQGGIISSATSGGGSDLESLIDAAKKVNDLDSYAKFRKEIKDMPATLLPADARSLIAASIADGFGRSYGLTKAEIKSAFKENKKVGKYKDNSNLPTWARGWCYIEKTNEFYHISTAHAINKEAFNARFNRRNECQMAETNAATLVLDKCGLDTYADYMYWPGAGDTFEVNGNVYVNTYNTIGCPEPKKAETNEEKEALNIINKHFEMLISNEKDRTLLLDWLSHVYRNPGERVNWVILLQGSQGIGKSFIETMMTLLMGKNSKVLDATALGGRFTSWATGSTLTTVEEIKIAGESQYATMDRIKPYISNDTIQIEEKGRDTRVVPNFTNYLFLTNHKDALPIGADDRRYAVIYSDIQNRSSLHDAIGGKENEYEYFKTLFDATKKHISAIGYWLKTREISKEFNPKGRAPHTSSFDEALLLSGNTADYLFDDAMSRFECEVINTNIIDLTWLNELAAGSGVEMPKTLAVKAILLKLNYVQFGSRIYVAKLKNRHTVWYKKQNMSESQVEETIKSFFEKSENENNNDENKNDFDQCPF